MKTKVAIIGGGVAGLMLANLLYTEGVECVILERQTRAYTEARIRAGVLEHGTVTLLHRAGVGANMDAKGLPHDGFSFLNEDGKLRIDLKHLAGQGVMVYGQTEITIDLMDACAARGIELVFEAGDVALHEVNSPSPYVTYTKDGQSQRLDCDFIAGCDGFHGICRQSIPGAAEAGIEKLYPFGWLGILADVPPMDHELIYASHERGFALASMRSATRSRYYLQVSHEENLNDWSQERIWDELRLRLRDGLAGHITSGPLIEKSIVPLRSYVCPLMTYGRLFLCGDSAHIVPPTGAKGLNLAASDVAYLFEALVEQIKNGHEAGLKAYEARAQARIWKAERFSWAMTNLTHDFPASSRFDKRIQQAERAYIRTSQAAQTSIAENYIGLSL